MSGIIAFGMDTPYELIHQLKRQQFVITSTNFRRLIEKYHLWPISNNSTLTKWTEIGKKRID